MFALEPVITARVQAALAPLAAGWTTHGHAGSTGERKPGKGPVAVVAFSDARPADVRGQAATIDAAWQVLLVASRGATAPALVDAAIAAVIAALHHWRPGASAERQWEALRLSGVQSPAYPDDGLLGIEITFTTTALYRGQP